MTLEAAMAQAWDSLSGKAVDRRVRFLGEEFSIGLANTLVTATGEPTRVDDGLAS